MKVIIYCYSIKAGHKTQWLKMFLLDLNSKANKKDIFSIEIYKWNGEKERYSTLETFSTSE